MSIALYAALLLLCVGFCHGESYAHVAFEFPAIADRLDVTIDELELEGSTTDDMLASVTVMSSAMSSATITATRATMIAMNESTATTRAMNESTAMMRATTRAQAKVMAISDAVVTIEPIEGLGPVRILFKDIVLGVPSPDAESVFNPVEGIHIIIPAGAWPQSGRREAEVLTLTVFELPGSLIKPGFACGPAIDLGPALHRFAGRQLAKPIIISTPCAKGRVYSLDTMNLLWTADQSAFNQSVFNQNETWAQTQTMGVHASLTDIVALTEPSNDPLIGVIISCVIAGLAFVAFVTILCVYRRGKVAHDRQSAQAQLAFAEI